MLSRAPLCLHKPRYWFGCYSTGTTIEDKEISEIIINTVALIPCCFCATGICSRFFSGDPKRVAWQGYWRHCDRLSYTWLLWRRGQHGQVGFFAIVRGLCGFFCIDQRFVWTVCFQGGGFCFYMGRFAHYHHWRVDYSIRSGMKSLLTHISEGVTL